MPEDSTRSSAARATASMSTSRSSSSWIRYSMASSTRMRCRLVRPWKRLPSMSFMLMPISSTPCGPGDLDGREALLAHLHLDEAAVELAVAQLRAQLLARLLELVVALGARGRVGVGVRLGRRSRRSPAEVRWREEEVEDAFFGVELGLFGDLVDLLLAHHVDGDLGQVADHALHVAADVADLSELRSLDLEEGRVGHAREAARDLGLADAGRADHDDVLGHHVGGHLGREFLAADAVAQRDGDGALGRVLADDVLVELRDDLPRRHLVEPRILLDLA